MQILVPDPGHKKSEFNKLGKTVLLENDLEADKMQPCLK